MGPRLVIVLAVAAALSALAAPAAAQPCREAAIVAAGEAGAVVRTFDAGALPGAAAVADGTDGWLVGGDGIVRLRADGTRDPAWAAGLPGSRLPVRVLATAPGRLYATDGRRITAFDLATRRPLWTTARVRGGEIAALAATRLTVFAGGDFTRLGNLRRRGLVAFRADRGTPLTAALPTLRGPARPAVSALDLDGPRLYLGGTFTSASRHPRRSGAAAFDVRTGRVTAFAPSFTGWDVRSIAVAAGTAAVGGTFGGGAFDAATGAPRPWSRAVSGAKVLTVAGTTLYLGGDLRSSVGPGNLEALDLESGAPLAWAPSLAPFTSVAAIAVSGSRALVTGSFCTTLD